MYDTSQVPANPWLLDPFRSVLKDGRCDIISRNGAIVVLRETGSRENVSLFKQILADPDATDGQRGGAAYGMAKAGDESSIDYLRQMAGCMFDFTIVKEHPVLPILAFEGFSTLAKKNPEVNRIIQDLALRCCRDTDPRYVYRETLFTEPMDALASVGGKENARFIERVVIPTCREPRIIPAAIEVLGRIGDKESIRVLGRLRPQHPDLVTDALEKIEERYPADRR